MRRFQFRILNAEDSDSSSLKVRRRGLAPGRFLVLLVLFGLSSSTCSWGQTPLSPIQNDWPKGYEASFGFEIMLDHNGIIIVSSVDSTTQAYRSGVRPGMEIIGWNTLPVVRKLESMKVRKYRKYFPAMTDQNIKLLLLPRGQHGASAEVFLLTDTGNNRGVRVTAGLD